MVSEEETPATGTTASPPVPALTRGTKDLRVVLSASSTDRGTWAPYSCDSVGRGKKQRRSKNMIRSPTAINDSKTRHIQGTWALYILLRFGRAGGGRNRQHRIHKTENASVATIQPQSIFQRRGMSRGRGNRTRAIQGKNSIEKGTASVANHNQRFKQKMRHN